MIFKLNLKVENLERSGKMTRGSKSKAQKKCENNFQKCQKMMIFETLTSWTSRLIRIQTSHRDSHQIPDMYYVQAASLFSVICEQCQKDTKGQIMGHPSTLKDF